MREGSGSRQREESFFRTTLQKGPISQPARYTLTPKNRLTEVENFLAQEQSQ
jgi:hypothetical protein